MKAPITLKQLGELIDQVGCEITIAPTGTLCLLDKDSQTPLVASEDMLAIFHYLGV